MTEPNFDEITTVLSNAQHVGWLLSVYSFEEHGIQNARKITTWAVARAIRLVADAHFALQDKDGTLHPAACQHRNPTPKTTYDRLWKMICVARNDEFHSFSGLLCRYVVTSFTKFSGQI